MNKIKSIKVRPNTAEKAPCHFCGATKKVKYNAVLEDGTEVPCCVACEHKMNK